MTRPCEFDMTKIRVSKYVLSQAIVFFTGLALLSVVTAIHARVRDAPAPTRFAAQRFDAWRILGPGGGGAQFYPAVSPLNPNLVLVACDMTGAYISHDGGNSWRMFNLREPVKFFAFDPSDARTIYAGAAALWRSTDTGRTWNLVYPAPGSVSRLIMPDDHASPIIEASSGPAEPVSALAVDPANSKSLYAVIGRGADSALYISKDWGASWERSVSIAPSQASASRVVHGEFEPKIYIDPQSPKSGRTIYLIGADSVHIRRAGKWNHDDRPVRPLVFGDASAGFSSNGELFVYAVANPEGAKGAPRGILISHDGGATWNASDGPFVNPARGHALELGAIATSLEHGEVAYVSFENYVESQPASSAHSDPFHGVAKTTDGGKTWQFVWKEAETPAHNVHDAWITERLGSDWGEPGISLGVAPTDPNICYRTDDGRTMRTTDGGRTWLAVYSKKLADHTYTSTGLDVTTNYGVFFDPFDSKRMFIAYTDIGLFRSENAGQSWTSATIGVPRRWTNTTYWITFDPEVKGRVWGVMSYTHDLPRAKMWRHASPSTFAGGVCISDDGGKTWRASNTGMPPTAATHILLDPESPAQARVLYVTGFGKGVFKSIDGGKMWSLKNNGLPGPEPFAWRLARDKNGVLYLVVARRSEDGSFGNDRDGALYRSTDGAEHWVRVQLPEGVNGPNGIAIDPADPSRLYLAAWGRNTPQGAVQGGIYVSSDGGKSWRNTLARDQHVYDITIDTRDSRTLYACGFESSAWRSIDRGETWKRIQGFNFKWGHRVIPDPQDPAMIYVTTFGGSVWHGPAAGDPSPVEDIVTPVLSYKK
ncbi:MAG: hypothetical protein ACYDA9_13380 [Terriglobia bacterium]